jgi:hypothetical protein
MTAGSSWTATVAGQLWSCFGASEREGALRVWARLGATGLRVASVMSDQELSRLGLGGEIVEISGS